MPIISCGLFKDIDLHLEDFMNTFSVKTKYGSMAGTLTPIVIFASIFIGWSYGRRAWRVENKGRRVYSRSMCLGALHGGKLAMERLIEYHHARIDSESLRSAESDMKKLLQEEHPDFSKLQTIAAKLEMSGKEAEAERILKDALKKARTEGKKLEEYEIDMLLTEMYIYKGDFKTAESSICLSHVEISDARRPLYKAIIQLMMQRPRQEVEKYWNEFVETRDLNPASCQDSELERKVTDFQEFEKIVTSLKHEIYEK